MKTSQASFGGAWTDLKLEILAKYIPAYLKVFKDTRNDYHLCYIDAFAGTGWRTKKSVQIRERISSDDDPGLTGLPIFEVTEVMETVQGSARMALEFDPAFDSYIFIEKRKTLCDELASVQEDYPSKLISIRPGDANEILRKIASSRVWGRWQKPRYRAVAFLDPFGMQLEWSTLEALANTGAMDIWILIPLNQATNRLLARNPNAISPGWHRRLTAFFGTDGWKDVFYKPIPSIPRPLSLFDEPKLSQADKEQLVRVGTWDDLAAYIVARLGQIFPAVCEKPKILYAKGNPLFMFGFVSANRFKGGQIAKGIADSIIRNTG